ncbi:response regulator [Candidatus Saccharibacteria bacterium]|nr:response regulator [Candidatus Saccharibacteria bacterium]
MSKIMLVEDDNNLREIYEARLAAEGYEIVSAPDGEAALALGVKEKPDLIIADIMMPKVSGFDMLDIMRSTTETKNAKIIMMTALNQAEDKAKAEQLGADLYLVKSQVTLEDVVRSAKKLLGAETPLNIGGIQVEQPNVSNNASTQNTTSMTADVPAVPQNQTNPQQQPAPTPPAPTPQPIVPSTQPPQPAPAQPTPAQTVPPQPAPAAPQPQPAPAAEAPQQPATPAVPQQVAPTTTQSTDSNIAASSAESKSNEEALLQEQIEQFISEENPTISTDANTPAQPAPAAEAPQQPATPAVPQPQPEVSAPAPSMAAPPKDMPQTDPQTTALSDDAPAGERVIQKNNDNVPTEGGITQNAEISGRKKVIKPISDVLTKGPDLNALLEKEKTASPSTAPTVNSVVSPEGITSTPNLSASNKVGDNQSSPVMSDIIAPNPSAAPVVDPNNPPAPPVA